LLIDTEEVHISLVGNHNDEMNERQYTRDRIRNECTRRKLDVTPIEDKMRID